MTFLYTTVVTAVHIFTYKFHHETITSSVRLLSSTSHVMSKQLLLFISIIIQADDYEKHVCTVIRGDLPEYHPQFKLMSDEQWERFKRVYDASHSQYVNDLLVELDIPEVSEEEEEEEEEEPVEA